MPPSASNLQIVTELAEFARRQQVLSSKVARLKDLVKNLWDRKIYIVNEEDWLALSDRYLLMMPMFTD